MTALHFAEMMATPVGRLARIAAGAALVALGYALGGSLGIVLAVVGLVPIAAGLFNVCFIAPLLRVPLRGRKLRELKTS